MKFITKIGSLFLIGLMFFPALAKSQIDRPKLVVGIVVDQMRWDYLYRYQDSYRSDGFKRLMKDGFNCQQTLINYLPTYTAVGHASIYTGSVPALNGIVANDWFDRQTGQAVYCTDDSTVTAVGGSKKAGAMSPKNLLATTITDELRLATNFKSRVFGLSMKDRGAILPAGHSANAAYWYDATTGDFMTSDYYQKELPKWLLDFNKRKLSDSLMNRGWDLLLPDFVYGQSTEDDVPYEGVIKGEQKAVFPHLFNQLKPDEKRKGILYTPFGNTLLRMLAEKCVQEEKLGQGLYTDFLTVSFSSTDYAGHLFGPNSMEVEDIYLRLDGEIAQLLHFLDAQIGQGNYLVFLTADHGGAHNAQFLKDHKIPAASVSVTKSIKGALNSHLQDWYRQQTGKAETGNFVHSLYNYQVYLDEQKVNKLAVNRPLLLQEAKNWLAQQEGVTAVYNLEEGEQKNAPEPLQTMITNGYFQKRCGSLQIILNPQWYSGYAPTGTTHGSWNPYDAHIPLLWYGWHIQPGEKWGSVNITDIAPTLAALLHIQQPNASIGHVITELIKN